MKYHLVIFRFSYTDAFTCLWPVFFDHTFENAYGQKQIDYFERVLQELRTFPGISNVQIVHNKIADEGEVHETISAILSGEDSNIDVKIKYLEVDETVRLSDSPRLDYDSGNWYIPVRLFQQKFPIRVRAKQFRFLLDDLELPVILLQSSNQNG